MAQNNKRAKTTSNRSKSGTQSEDRLVTTSENVARILGIIFIALGAILIVALIGGFVVSKIPYRADPNLPIPTLDDIPTHTNKDRIDIPGTNLPDEEVVLYKDGERLSETVVTDEDGEFIFTEVQLEEEGEVSFEAASIRGGLFKRRSEYSNLVATNVDWTSPSTTISLEYEDLSVSDLITIKGTAEPNSIVILEGPEKTYKGHANDKGEFVIKDVKLIEGENSFRVRISDSAGNEVVASKTVEVTYDAGEINGNGVATGPDGTVAGAQLPEAAGELDAALEQLLGSNLMLGFAVLALGLFGVSSVTAYVQARRHR